MNREPPGAGDGDSEYNSVFNFLHGSLFGDFNSNEPDRPNLMRIALASEGMALTVAWPGQPFWFPHTMGTGETIGHSLVLSQRNQQGGAVLQIAEH